MTDIDAHLKEWQRFKNEDLGDLHDMLAWWRDSKPERDRYMEAKKLHEARTSRLGDDDRQKNTYEDEIDRAKDGQADAARVAEDEARARAGLKQSASAPQPSAGTGGVPGGPSPSPAPPQPQPAAPPLQPQLGLNQESGNGISDLTPLPGARP